MQARRHRLETDGWTKENPPSGFIGFSKSLPSTASKVKKQQGKVRNTL
jgi:hypothetical protein